jgi:hypothetical protein
MALLEFVARPQERTFCPLFFLSSKAKPSASPATAHIPAPSFLHKWTEEFLRDLHALA